MEKMLHCEICKKFRSSFVIEVVGLCLSYHQLNPPYCKLTHGSFPRYCQLVFVWIWSCVGLLMDMNSDGKCFSIALVSCMQNNAEQSIQKWKRLSIIGSRTLPPHLTLGHYPLPLFPDVPPRILLLWTLPPVTFNPFYCISSKKLNKALCSILLSLLQLWLQFPVFNLSRLWCVSDK